jgi:hypothetical protein
LITLGDDYPVRSIELFTSVDEAVGDRADTTQSGPPG